MVGTSLRLKLTTVRMTTTREEYELQCLLITIREKWETIEFEEFIEEEFEDEIEAYNGDDDYY